MAFALHPTSVRTVRVAPLDIPLLAPFGISKGALDLAANVLLAVELSDGTMGYGEAAPFPAYNGETQAAALSNTSRSGGQLASRARRHRLARDRPGISRDGGALLRLGPLCA
jgi:L-alanine-DL-glutamate epimerase-like enolase superfamily enzyme